MVLSSWFLSPNNIDLIEFQLPVDIGTVDFRLPTAAGSPPDNLQALGPGRVFDQHRLHALTSLCRA